MPRPADPFDQVAFSRAWCDGVGTAALGRTFGHSPAWVSATAKRLGLPSRHGEGRHALAGGQWVPGPHGVRVYQMTTQEDVA